MGKVIERNGGRSVLVLGHQVTHVLTRGVSRGKIFVVRREFVHECVRAGRLLPSGAFSALGPPRKGIASFLKRTS
jgi:hypothetical protein